MRIMTDEKKPVSIKPVQVSNAPPPITPLRGYVGSNFTRKIENPKWKFWETKTKAELWECAYLGCNLNPRSDSCRDIDTFGIEDKRVAELLELLIDRVNGSQWREFFSDVEYRQSSNRTGVSLPEFAAWCKHIEWDIPAELAALASNNSMKLGKMENLDKYLHMDLWSDSDLQALLCGLPPDGARPLNADLNEAATAIQRAVTAGVLHPINKENATPGDRVYAQHRYFRPADAIRWANSKRALFPAFPFSMDSIQQAPPPAVEQTSPGVKPEVVPTTTPADDVEPDHAEALAALFDHVPVKALEKMFPADGKWKSWTEKAATNGLINARTARARFNPYKAALWFMDKGMTGWDLARCNRVLVNNLPARSKEDAHLLTGGID